MKHVYVLESLSNPARRYVGSTFDIENRLAEHNAGESVHTRKYCPWRVGVKISFADDDKAEAFERYLKSGSGRAFQRKHFS